MSIENIEARDREEIDRTYPAGSLERDVIEYSRSSHPSREVPPLLRSAFWVLMGISILLSLSALIGLLQADK